MRRAQTRRLIPALSGRQWALAAAGLWLAVNLLCLDRFPTVFIDEAENGNHAYNAAFHGQAVFSLYDGLYPAHLEFLRQSWPPVIRPVFVRFLAGFIKIAGFSLFRGRLLSLLLAFFCLLLVYGAGVKLGGPAWGLCAMALLGTYFPFLYSSHSIRPEIFLACDGLGVFCLILHGLEGEGPGWFIAAGVLAGLAPGIHTNGVALVVPVSVALLARRHWRGCFWTAVGWVIGTLVFVRLADWERFVPGYYALFFREFTAPPLLSERGNLWRILLDESGRYFGAWIFGQWKGGLLFSKLLSMEHTAIAAVVLWGCWQKGRERFAALFAASLAVAYALVVGQKASNYLTALAPFFALSAAGWFAGTLPLRISDGAFSRTSQSVRAGLAIAGWAVFGAGTAGTILMVASVASYHPSLTSLARRFSAQVPASARLAGPQELWLGMPSDHYRDIGALVWHRLLLNEKNLWKPLEGWKPEYLILDNSMAARLARLASEPRQPRMREPTGFLPWPHQVLDVVRTGPAYGGSMALIHIDWPPATSS